MNLRRLGAVALLTIVLSGCATVELRKAPAPVDACDNALASGFLIRSRESGIALRDATEDIHQVLWPFGYAARVGLTGVELLDETGKVVAHEGDFIQAGGGFAADGAFGVCAGSVTVVPAPG